MLVLHNEANFYSLADRASPGASFTIHLKVGLKVEALYMFAIMASGWQCDFLEGYGTLE